MRKALVTAATWGTAAALLFWPAGCAKKGPRSSMSVCQPCEPYQKADVLPADPAPDVFRLAIGGDSRDDKAGVIPWAFAEAKKRGARAFFFLGDLELTPAEDALFEPKLEALRPVPFYPAMGNHEIEVFGFLRLWRKNNRERLKEFRKRFLGAPGITVAPFEDEVVWAADFGGRVHLVAMDNVSRRGEGFGPEQLNWVEQDLTAANAAGKTIIVGMHKGLANNPVTKHAMDEDGANAINDSDAALKKFQAHKVALVVVSHSHMYAAYQQGGIEVRLTGGMGAPLVKGLKDGEGGFHHLLLADVPHGAQNGPIRVEVVKFPGAPITTDTDEADEIE